MLRKKPGACWTAPWPTIVPPGLITGAPADEAVLLIVMIPKLSRSVRSVRGPTNAAYSASKLFTLAPLLRLTSLPTKKVPAIANVWETDVPALDAEVPSPNVQAIADAVTPDGNVKSGSKMTGWPAVAKTVVVLIRKIAAWLRRRRIAPPTAAAITMTTTATTIHLRLSDVGGASDVGGSDVGAAGDPCTLSPPPEMRWCASALRILEGFGSGAGG